MNADIEALLSDRLETRQNGSPIPIERNEGWFLCTQCVTFALTLALLIFCFNIALFHPVAAGYSFAVRVWLLFFAGAILASSLHCMSLCTSSVPQEPYNERNRTWFGHRMSYEGEWRNIPVVLCATWSFVLCLGGITSLSTDCHILVIPGFYLVGLVVFYAWHWLAHGCVGTELHHIHMEHHQDRYPPQDFYGDSHDGVQQQRMSRGNRAATIWELMIDPSGSATMTISHEGPLVFAIGIVLIGANLLLGVSLSTCAFAACGYLFMASFGSAIHMSFHERDFDWECYVWYRELRSLHMIHHIQRKNFAMVNILLDLVFGSLLIKT